MDLLNRPRNSSREELEALGLLIDWIDGLLLQQDGGALEFPEVLLTYHTYRPFEELDDDVVASVVRRVYDILSDDAMIPMLVAGLHTYQNRNTAATLLGWFGARARVAIPDLVGVASGNSGAVGSAKQAVKRIGNAVPYVISALQESLNSGDDGEFRELVHLMFMLPDAQDEIPQILRTAATNKNRHIREWTAYLIGDLSAGQKGLFKEVLQSLASDVDPEVRNAAIEALTLSPGEAP